MIKILEHDNKRLSFGSLGFFSVVYRKGNGGYKGISSKYSAFSKHPIEVNYSAPPTIAFILKLRSTQYRMLLKPYKVVLERVPPLPNTL